MCLSHVSAGRSKMIQWCHGPDKGQEQSRVPSRYQGLFLMHVHTTTPSLHQLISIDFGGWFTVLDEALE